MALINRVTQLFKADVHAVLDRIEEPEQLLKQAIREMEHEVAAAEQRARVIAQEAQTLGERKTELGAKIKELDEELDLCFAKKKEDLARSLVRRKLEAQRLVKRLVTKTDSGKQALEAAQKEIDESRSVLESLKQKAEIFGEQPAASPNSPADALGFMARELTISDDELDVAFLREQAKRTAS